MFELMESVYDGIFTAIITFVSLIIVYHVLQRVINCLFTGEEKESGYVLVTGCDTGFGYNTALELNNRGIYVFAGCLTKEAVQRFNDDENFKGMAVVMDVSKMEDINNVKNIIEEEVKDKGLWSIVNNAGIIKLGPIEWLSVKHMQSVMDVNLWGMVNVTKAMLPLIKKARGRVINMSSIFGRISNAYMCTYCMSKYAIEAFSDTLRYEMKPWGVSVHIIEPGSHSTEFLTSGHEKMWEELWNAQPNQIQEDYGEDFRKDVITRMQNKAKQIGANPQNVINAYCHAVLSPRPKLRYIVGTDANTVGLALATLPTTVGDFIKGLLIKPVIPAAMKNAK